MSPTPPEPWPEHTGTEPADASDVPRKVTSVELLALCEEFFRTTTPAVQDELRGFLTARTGAHPSIALSWFIDSLGSATLRSGPAEGS